jgi:hypothetical protein
MHLDNKLSTGLLTSMLDWPYGVATRSTAAATATSSIIAEYGASQQQQALAMGTASHNRCDLEVSAPDG